MVCRVFIAFRIICRAGGKRQRSDYLVRTHERHQASRGGLTGSDGSGWSVLAVRDEARRGYGRSGVQGGLRPRMTQVGGGRRKGRQRTRTGATIAIVSTPWRDVIVLLRMSILGVVLRPVTMMRVVVPTRLAEVLHHDVLRTVLRETEHGSSHRAPDGEQQDHQEHQRNAHLLHGFSLSQSSRAGARTTFSCCRSRSSNGSPPVVPGLQCRCG